MITEQKWNILQQRHFTAGQTIVWKAVNSQIAVHISDYFNRPTAQSRGHHPYSYINMSSKMDGYKYSLYPRESTAGIYSQNPTSWKRALTVLKVPSGMQ